MPPKRDPVPRVRSAPQWLGGLFVLGMIGAAVIAGGAVLWENVDIQRMTASAALRLPHTAPPALMPAYPAHSDRVFNAALYSSSASSTFFESESYYLDLLERWESLLRDAGAEVVRVSSPDDVASLDSNLVLVAPSAVCLAEDEVAALEGFAARGGGLVLTWATGARDSSCNWLGWEALTHLTGIAEFSALEEREAVYLTVPSGLPISAGIGPATRVELRHESQIASATTGTRLYWSDWALNAAPVDEAPGMDAAAWLGRTSGEGRVVWFGFRLSHGASERDERYLEKLFRNGIWWAAGIPVAEVSAWPNGAQSAFMLTQDVESHFNNATALATLAKERAVPITYFVVSQVAAEYPMIADSLSEVGELGSHTSDHAVLAGRAYADQRARLSRSQAEIRSWSGTPAYGLRPPEERFDDATLRAWAWTGGSYVVGSNEARTGSPEVYETPDGLILMLPRIIKNDYNVYVQDGAMRSRRLTEAFLAGMAKVNALGALAIVSLRTQVGGEGNRIQAVGEVVDSARVQGDWWFASGREMADWWLSRWESVVGVSEPDDGQVNIVVQADSLRNLTGAWLELFLPGDPQDWVPRTGEAMMRHLRTDWGVRIPLPTLEAGTQVIVSVTEID